MLLAKLRKVKMASSSPHTPSSSNRGNEVRRLDCLMQSPSSGHRPDGPRWRRLSLQILDLNRTYAINSR